MLVKEVLGQFRGKLNLRHENWGRSSLAERYGIKAYPIVFVNEIPVALPQDFGYFGKAGKYSPWSEARHRNAFVQDLKNVLTRAIAGEKLEKFSRANAVGDPHPTELPTFSFTTIDQKRISSKDCEDRPTVVELWAAWCPPCRDTLPWMNEIVEEHGESICILSLCVESEKTLLRKMRAELAPDLPVIAATAEQADRFGSITQVPTVIVFDRKGKRIAIFYGAPENLREQLGDLLADALQKDN